MSNYRVSYILDIMVLTIRYKKNVERCIEMETRSESGSINAPPAFFLFLFFLLETMFLYGSLLVLYG